MKDTGCAIGAISGSCFSAIIEAEGEFIGEPGRSGQGVVIADLDLTFDPLTHAADGFALSYSRPEFRSLAIDDRSAAQCINTVQLHRLLWPVL